MREEVPDLVAQEFVKHFLGAFSGGQSSYLAVRYARQRLQALEDNYPAASWLPVIYQNPAEEPSTWREVKDSTRRWRLLQTVLLSVILTPSTLLLLLHRLPFHITSLPPSSFQYSCEIESFSIAGNNVSAECKQSGDGSYKRTTISVPGIRNRNGNLVFVGFNSPSNFQDPNECKLIILKNERL